MSSWLFGPATGLLGHIGNALLRFASCFFLYVLFLRLNSPTMLLGFLLYILLALFKAICCVAVPQSLGPFSKGLAG